MIELYHIIVFAINERQNGVACEHLVESNFLTFSQRFPQNGVGLTLLLPDFGRNASSTFQDYS